MQIRRRKVVEINPPVKFPNSNSKCVKVLDFPWLSFKSPWYSRTFFTGGNPHWQRSTAKSVSMSLSQHASVILTTLKPPTGTRRTVLWLRAGVANEVCVYVCVCAEVVGTWGSWHTPWRRGWDWGGAARGHAVITHHSPCGQWPDWLLLTALPQPKKQKMAGGGRRRRGWRVRTLLHRTSGKTRSDQDRAF